MHKISLVVLAMASVQASLVSSFLSLKVAFLGFMNSSVETAIEMAGMQDVEILGTPS